MKLKLLYELNEQQMHQVYNEIERFYIEAEAYDEFCMKISRLNLTEETKKRAEEIYSKKYSEKISIEVQTNVRKYDSDRVYEIEDALETFLGPNQEKIMSEIEEGTQNYD